MELRISKGPSHSLAGSGGRSSTRGMAVPQQNLNQTNKPDPLIKARSTLQLSTKLNLIGIIASDRIWRMHFAIKDRSRI